ncbi:MAG: TOMM precursor leader peptide-binding protein [Rhodospirillales bacterium]|nr:TOMM precursor leader peptide-binding protein [Rhodospirillales bacterium]
MDRSLPLNAEKPEPQRVCDEESPLALAPHFSLHRLAQDKYLLLSEDRSVKLNDPFYVHILPLLDGVLNGRQIVERLAAKTGREHADNIAAFLGAMIDKGYVVALDPRADTARTAFLSASGLDPVSAGRTLAALKVAVVALGRDGAAGPAATADFAAMLMAEGVGVADPETAAVTVVVVEDYLQPAVREWASHRATDGKAWIPFKPGGTQAWFGPLIAPRAEGGACYFCLVRRLAEHRPGDQVVQPTLPGARPAKGWTKASLAMAQALATREVVEYGLSRRRDVADHLLSWKMADARKEKHPLPRFPDCPHCGTAAPAGTVQSSPVRLAHTGAINDLDGGWRALAPAEALARLEGIVSPLTGIVAAQRPANPGEGLHVYTASQGASVPIDPRMNRRLGRPGGAAGKGVSEIQAKISCLAEAIERYSCNWTGAEPRRQASWADVAEAAPHPDLLLQFSARQYEDRETLNKSLGAMGRIPARFCEDAVIDWTPAWSLRDDAARWLPSRFCYFDYQALDLPGDHPFCHADSNGCSSGGSLEEAILQGFFELVERDAISLWWYNRLPRSSIDPAGVDDAFLAHMQTHYAGIGRTLHVLDLTTDLGVPVAAAVSATTKGGRILIGFGAHLDGHIAVLRALAELNQILLFDAEVDRQANRSVDDALWRWIDHETLAGHPYLAPADGPTIAATSLPRPRFATMAEAVRHCVRLVAAEHDFIVHDLSRPDLPLNCVRVVVPGLRHFWNRRGPGRLFDVPAKMGWLAHPHLESELNPQAFFL